MAERPISGSHASQHSPRIVRFSNRRAADLERHEIEKARCRTQSKVAGWHSLADDEICGAEIVAAGVPRQTLHNWRRNQGLQTKRSLHDGDAVFDRAAVERLMLFWRQRTRHE